MLSQLKKLSFKTHLVTSIVIRLVLIIYGEIQDLISDVPYTDVDYKVVTDGARHILNGDSPFKRHTYRYTPLLAYSVIPNILIHKCFGKILFSFFDLLVGILIKKIVFNEFEEIFINNANALMEKFNEKNKNKFNFKNSIKIPEKYRKIAEYSSYLWLYNPLSIVIATRGNGDSIAGLFVLLSMYFLLKPKNRTFIAGLFHGLAIHFRLYPLAFSLAYFLVLSGKNIFIPNRKQLSLILGTIISFTALTGLFYQLYGYEFLYESYIYHLIRKDTKHNFSLYFYLQYLGAEYQSSIYEKILTFSPQLIILLFLSIQFGWNKKTLPFCIFAQAFTMVTYNPVVTSQYFVWFLSILPLCAKNFKKIGMKSGISYGIIWILGQGGWLLPAYFLEFKGWNTFEFIWLQGIIFFSANIFILQRLIVNFDVISDFNKIK